MRLFVLLAVLLNVFAGYAVAQERYELRVPLGWGDIRDYLELCTKVDPSGDSGCDVAPIDLGYAAASATFFRMQGTPDQITEFTAGDFFPFPWSRGGDFSPFPWSDTVEKFIDVNKGFGLDPSNIPIIPRACTIANVSPDCTCVDLPLGGMRIVCDEPRLAPPMTLPPLPPGHLRAIRG